MRIHSNPRRAMGRRSERSMMLLELMVVCLLYASFSLLLAELFVASIHAQTGAAQRVTFIHRVDDSAAQLRRDVWSATALNAAGESLQITGSQGQQIVWTWSSSPEQAEEWLGRGRLVRTQSGPGSGLGDTRMEFTWIQMPRATFEVQGPLVTLHLAAAAGIQEARASGPQAGAGQSEEQAVFCSQHLLAQSAAGGGK